MSQQRENDIMDMRLGDALASLAFHGSYIAIIWAFGHFAIGLW